MVLPKMTRTQLEIPRNTNRKAFRYPNLQTILMVEEFLEAHRDLPMRPAELRTRLPKQVMHQTLKVVLEYLWKSGKIIYGPRGVQWIFATPEHLDAMMNDAFEV